MGRAIFKQKNGLVGVVVVTDCGVIPLKLLNQLTLLADALDSKACKLTTRQTMVFLLPEQNVDKFIVEIEKLGLSIGGFEGVVRNVKGCSGNNTFCPRSYGEALETGIEIQKTFMNQKTPKDFKISVAGCNRGCTDPYCADLGLIARGEGRYDLYLGGRGGSKNPRHGRKIYSKVPQDQLEKTINHILEQYRSLGEDKERICLTIDRVGLAPFILKDLTTPVVQDISDSAPLSQTKPIAQKLERSDKEQLIKTENIDKDLEECCSYQNCDDCTHQNCIVGFSKIISSYAKDKNTYLIPEGLQAVPKADFKVYDQEKIAAALMSTLFLCKECKDNHEHSCFINQIRLSLEIGLLGDNLPYDGTLFKYIIRIKEKNLKVGNSLIHSYENQKKKMAMV